MNGQAELKCNNLSYSGEFKDGEISGKGTFKWTKEGLTCQFQGMIKDSKFLSGKFEIKQGEKTIHSFEGVFDVPF